MNQRVLKDEASAKGKVLRAAAVLFREKGFARTTVRDIAAEVGILSGSLFHHFPNKEAILAQLMEELILSVEEEMDNQLHGVADSKRRLAVLVTCELSAIHAQTGTGFSILMTEWRSLGKVNQAHILSLRNRYEQRWLDCLRALKADGLMPIDPALARNFIRGAAMETWHWYNPKGAMGLSSLAEELVNLVSR
ncbi:TetR/AcrR family transcriptional regulator [Simiduia curdlanivorans]|uniref:TetR/AcrR family transcriptional regulator n=1 Tax=Simiduia curdlanivorans TaxID=1492769 RepID=A0ABV8V9Z2_9GAMM|nr:TetR/AcrR family transcriptional regulator [Simiduia curdlanivorans]MDN3639657.1 TetR/AcrR family transcriptional regulator [Simiduia curdlanivorans]